MVDGDERASGEVGFLGEDRVERTPVGDRRRSSQDWHKKQLEVDESHREGLRPEDFGRVGTQYARGDLRAELQVAREPCLGE